MIIGLAGFKGSGKDTVAAYLVKEHGFERKAFADPLKQSIAALFNIEFHQVDQLKNDPDVWVALEVGCAESDYIDRMTFRTFLQRYGTESHRNVFGQDFWIDQTLPVQGFYPGRAIVVTDVRFQNEADRIRHLGGTLWFINRPTGEFSFVHAHSSEEIDFDTDLVIDNLGTIEDLYKATEFALSLVPVS